MELWEGFDLTVKMYSGEYIVPSVMPPGKFEEIPALDVSVCPFRVQYKYNAIPPGMLGTLVVKLARACDTVDFMSFFFLVFKDREICQIFCYNMELPVGHSANCKKDQDEAGVYLVVRASSQDLYEEVVELISSLDSLFPGLVQLDRHERPRNPRKPQALSGPSNDRFTWDGEPRVEVLPTVACNYCNKITEKEGLKSQDVCSRSSEVLICCECHKQNHFKDILTTLRIKDLRPCPCCSTSDHNHKGSFSAGKCRLQLGDDVESHGHQVATCQSCIASGCLGNVRILDIAPPEVFVFGCNELDTETVADIMNVLKEIELESDVLCTFKDLKDDWS
jgi:hypothetical protein